MIMRIVLVGAVILGAMIAVKDGRFLRNAGLIGSCTPIPSVAGEHVYWQACKKGKLDGRPDLSAHGCKAVAIRDGIEWWNCPASLGSSRTAS
jgi:hypothetical protein